MYAYLLIFHTGQIVVFLALLGLVALHIVAATARQALQPSGHVAASEQAGERWLETV